MVRLNDAITIFIQPTNGMLDTVEVLILNNFIKMS